MKHNPMYMKDYIKQLDSILSSIGEKILLSAGRVSHDEAITKAKEEYRKYQVKEISPVEKAYLETLKELNKEVKDNQNN